MAKLHPQVAEALETGYRASDPQNPFLWSSATWEAWEIGRYCQQERLAVAGIEKGRGAQWRFPSGLTIRLSYDSKGFVSIGKA